jgi:small subunit ribosomal protein S13
MADFKYLVRINDTDLDGKKRVLFGLTKIKGVSVMFSNAICNISGVSPHLILGELTDDQIKKLNEAFLQLDKIPTWLYNRQDDYETGKNKHLFLADLTFTQENDIKMLKKIKSYRGLRHQWNLPTRGQRTGSNFRRTKTANAKRSKRR